MDSISMVATKQKCIVHDTFQGVSVAVYRDGFHCLGSF